MIRGSPGNNSEAVSKIRRSGFSTSWQLCQDRQNVVVEHHIRKDAARKLVKVGREIIVHQSQAGEALLEGPATVPPRLGEAEPSKQTRAFGGNKVDPEFFR